MYITLYSIRYDYIASYVAMSICIIFKTLPHLFNSPVNCTCPIVSNYTDNNIIASAHLIECTISDHFSKIL